MTLEGFWEDPEGYVDEVVWPNYVREHKWMFENGDVDQGGLVDEVQKEKVLVAPGKGEQSMADILRWSVETIEIQISRVLAK